MRVDLTPAVSEQPATHLGEIGDPTMAFLAALAQFLPALAGEAETSGGKPGAGAAPGGGLPAGVTPLAGVPGPVAPTGVAGVEAAAAGSPGEHSVTEGPDKHLPDKHSLVLVPAASAVATVMTATVTADPGSAAASPTAPAGSKIVAAVQPIGIPASPATPESATVLAAPAVLPSIKAAPAENSEQHLTVPVAPVGSEPAAAVLPSIKAVPAESPEQHLTVPVAPVGPEPAAASPAAAGRRIHAAPAPAGPGAAPIASGTGLDVPHPGAAFRASHPADRGPVVVEATRSVPGRSAEPAVEPVGLTGVASPARPDSAPAAVAAGPVAGHSEPQVASQLAPYIAALRHGPDGSHHISVLLHPAELGQVQVVVELRAGTVNLTLSGAEAARDVLLGALPALRRDLTDAGLTVGRTDVFSQDPGTAGGANSGGHPGASYQPAPGMTRERTTPSPSPQLVPEPPSPPLRRVSRSGAVDFTI